MGGAASSLLCSLVAFYIERKCFPLIRLVHPEASLVRFADDLSAFELDKATFEFFLKDEYRAAGFTAEFELPSGEDESLTYLETRVCLKPYPHTRFYSQRALLFPTELALPDIGSARSQRACRTQLYSVVRRVYLAESTLWGFAETLIMLAAKHQQYPAKLFAQAAAYTLEHTIHNRYSLPQGSFKHLQSCIISGVSAYTLAFPPSFIFA